MQKFKVFIALTVILLLSRCKSYSFKNYNVGNAKTIQVNFIDNHASIIEPALSTKFTDELRNLFITHINLESTNTNGDLEFNGKIIDYKIIPVSGNASSKSSQNRLIVKVNIYFENKLDESKNYNKEFSFYSDFNANAQLEGNILENALSEIINRITQDIFNLALANDF